MASFNKVILMGNLTRDPEVRQAQSGNYICKLSLAVNRRYVTQGEQREEVTFVDIDAFGKQAEVISKYMTKGQPILIEGRLRLDKWTDKDGQNRSKLNVVCENFQFIGGSRNESDNESSGSGSSGNYEQNTAAPRFAGNDSQTEDIDEDVPF